MTGFEPHPRHIPSCRASWSALPSLRFPCKMWMLSIPRWRRRFLARRAGASALPCCGLPAKRKDCEDRMEVPGTTSDRREIAAGVGANVARCSMAVAAGRAPCGRLAGAGARERRARRPGTPPPGSSAWLDGVGRRVRGAAAAWHSTGIRGRSGPLVGRPVGAPPGPGQAGASHCVACLMAGGQRVHRERFEQSPDPSDGDTVVSDLGQRDRVSTVVDESWASRCSSLPPPSST